MCWVIVLLRMKVESGMAVVVVRLLAMRSGLCEFLCNPSVMPSVISSVIPKGSAGFKSERKKKKKVDRKKVDRHFKKRIQRCN